MSLAVCMGLLGGCGESKYDVFLEGQKIEGEAERGACALQYQEGSNAATISGDQVAWCLKETERALEYYDKAAAMGYDDPEFTRVYERAKTRRDSLKGKLEMIRRMEREQIEAKIPGAGR